MKQHIYSSPNSVAYALISHILELMKVQPEKVFNIAFSGGSTPAVLFDIWAHEMTEATAWDRIKVWFVDERCVSPDTPHSNYGLMSKLLLSFAPIPRKNIFRIRGEEKPEKEALRYSKELLKHVPTVRNYPSFDIVLLGVGADGHTSSIFPGQEHLLTSAQVYEVSEAPKERYKRIALTGRAIMSAKRVIFFVTGKEKASVVHEIFTSGDVSPSAYIAHHSKNVEFFLDKKAASKLEPTEVIIRT